MVGYKSESGAVWFGLATLAAIPFIPRRLLLLVLPTWAIASRYIARGARNHARPPNNSNVKSSLKISRNMSKSERPVALVTGTNSGIGYHTAVGLAAEGYIVVVTCRSAVLTQQTAEKIRLDAQRLQNHHQKRYSDSPHDIVVVGHLPIECDDFESVRSFAKWFRETYENRNFQVLVNNAGGMRSDLTFSNYNKKLEYHTAVNFLGPMLLTELLLPLLEKNCGRVVYVSSEAHRFPQMTLESNRFAMWKSKIGPINGKLLSALQQLNQGAEKCSGPLTQSSVKKSFVRYGTSKLLNTYHAHVIAHRYNDRPKGANRVYSCSLHPGCVGTNFSRDFVRNRLLYSIYQYAGLLFLKSCEEGAQTSLYCAMCPVDELKLVAPLNTTEGASVSPYFVECANKTHAMLLSYGWDVEEAEKIIVWGKSLVNLKN